MPSARAQAQSPAPDACAKVSLSTAPAKPVPVRQGTTGSGQELLALMWADKAAFPNNGHLCVLEPAEFAATDRVTAIQAGQLDAGTIIFPTLVAAVHARIDARAVATLVQVNKEDNEGTCDGESFEDPTRPSGSPGARISYAELDGRDGPLQTRRLLGPHFTAYSAAPGGAETARATATALGIELRAWEVRSVAQLGAADGDTVLVRHDGVVAWRGRDPAGVDAALRTVLAR